MELFYDIMKESYFSAEIRETVGYMLVTITDPRLKEELYYFMRIFSERKDEAFHKEYYISKPYYHVNNRDGTFTESEIF